MARGGGISTLSKGRANKHGGWVGRDNGGFDPVRCRIVGAGLIAKHRAGAIGSGVKTASGGRFGGVAANHRVQTAFQPSLARRKKRGPLRLAWLKQRRTPNGLGGIAGCGS